MGHDTQDAMPEVPMQSAPILTITLNPAVDLSSAVDHVRPGPKLRCAAPQFDPGGGGINVSRAVQILGGKSAAFVALGGVMGRYLLDLLAREGVKALPFDILGETRQSIAITDGASGEQFRFVMPGPVWETALCDAALLAVEKAIEPNALIVLSGSQPPGVPVDFAAQLAEVARKAGARLFVDTSGAPLAALAQAALRPFVLRMDDAEAVELAGRTLPDRRDAGLFAQELLDNGAAGMVIIAHGADGSTLASKQGLWHAALPVQNVVSAVGAGDSFVAGFALGLAREMAPPEALKFGTACAAAAVLTPATELCRPDDVEAALQACTLTQITL